MTNKIQNVKATFEALAKSKNDSNLTKIFMDVQDVTNAEGELVGVRLLSAVEPTSQYLYIPKEGQDFVAGFVFPGDDSAYSTQLALEVANAVRSIYPELPTNLVSVIAPIYSEAGVSFTGDGEEVYKIYREFMVRRGESITADNKKVADSIAA